MPPAPTRPLPPATRPRQALLALPALPAVLVLLALSACGGGEHAGSQKLVFCSTEQRHALVVEPVDEQGRVLADVQISWRLNGGSTQTQPCSLLPCAIDHRPGRYQLSAIKPGHAAASAEIQVERNNCHPLTERWRPMLRRL